MENEIKNNLTEPQEKVITLEDVVYVICGGVFIVFGFLALMSLIWCHWKLLQVSLTVIVFDLVVVAFSIWSGSLKKKVK